MKRLGINHFEFYKNKLTNKLDWTSLQGNEISEFLKNFNLTKILSDARVELIGSLWGQFLILNRSIHKTLCDLTRTKDTELPDNHQGLRGKEPLISISEFPKYQFFFFLFFFKK
jgi:UDP-N-acetylglucosamine transferase subunit ALG13